MAEVLTHSDGIMTCSDCGTQLRPATPEQDGTNNKWYLRQTCPGCGFVFVNQGPYNYASEVPGRGFTQGPGK